MNSFGPIGRFFEGPRWHDGHWWVSDMTSRVVVAIDTLGAVKQCLAFDDRPSGLGWLRDRSLIVVGMDRCVLHRVHEEGSSIFPYADLGEMCGDIEGHLNDMVVTSDGHAYVGFDPDFTKYGFQSEAGAIIHIDPSGIVSVAATGLHFPNGIVVTADNETLIVAETGSPRLTAFSRIASGELVDRRVWAEIGACRDQRVDQSLTLRLDAVGLDGCAIDAEGRVWVADSNSPACLLIGPDNVIHDAVFIPKQYRCLACALGGDDGQTLLLCGFELSVESDLATSTSCLFTVNLLDPGRSVAK